MSSSMGFVDKPPPRWRRRNLLSFILIIAITVSTIIFFINYPFPQEEESDDSDDQLSVARERIIEYLNRKGFKMVSFAGIRKYIDDQYTDEFLREIVRNFHKEFRKATIKGGAEGLSKL